MDNWKELMAENIVQEAQSSYKGRGNPLLEKSYQFALEIILVGQELQKKQEFILSRQLIRSGTSIGALSEEAQQAESRADFIHKLSIANKEAHETHYWLRLLRDAGLLPEDMSSRLLEGIQEIMRLLIAIIRKAKQNH